MWSGICVALDLPIMQFFMSIMVSYFLCITGILVVDVNRKHFITRRKIRISEPLRNGCISGLPQSSNRSSSKNKRTVCDNHLWDAATLYSKIVFLFQREWFVGLGSPSQENMTPLMLSWFFPCARPEYPVELTGENQTHFFKVTLFLRSCF